MSTGKVNKFLAIPSSAAVVDTMEVTVFLLASVGAVVGLAVFVVTDLIRLWM